MDRIAPTLLASLTTLCGILIGWFLRRGLDKAQIEKLKAEKIKYAGENLAKLQEKRNAYDKSCENCKRIVLKLDEEITNRIENVAKTREELCTALHNNAIPNYVNLIEWEQLLSKDNPDKLKILIAEEVIAELRRFKRWISIINHPKFLKDMKKAPSKVSKRTLSPFLQLLEDLSSKDKSTVEPLLRNAVNEIISEGL